MTWNYDEIRSRRVVTTDCSCQELKFHLPVPFLLNFRLSLSRRPGAHSPPSFTSPVCRRRSPNVIVQMSKMQNQTFASRLLQPSLHTVLVLSQKWSHRADLGGFSRITVRTLTKRVSCRGLCIKLPRCTAKRQMNGNSQTTLKSQKHVQGPSKNERKLTGTYWTATYLLSPLFLRWLCPTQTHGSQRRKPQSSASPVPAGIRKASKQTRATPVQTFVEPLINARFEQSGPIFVFDLSLSPERHVSVVAMIRLNPIRPASCLVQGTLL